MATILSSDIIYETVCQFGRTITSMRMSGVTSLSDVIHELQSHGLAPQGLTTINLRNGSQGWTSRHSVLLRA